MHRRAASPAPSEAELDIFDSLYPGDDATGATPGQELDLDDILNVEAADNDDGDDDEAFIGLQQAASYRKASNLKGRTVKKGGGFQAMGLNGNLLKAIARKGFSVPTPIQRKTIPLVLERKDVVGMARTGSGKTAAFVIPMVQRLQAHSARFGSRALILSPSRELAIQTLKVVKEFSKGTDLKTVLLVGGDSLEEQFGSVAANPDIVIATPGRFLHLKVEMGLNLSSVQYVVFDEADRLFEMGFAAQLTEILHALPPSRQTLLFSATLPASLVEFARAGLQDPSLIRLDAETKVSPDLESAFFSVKGNEKEGTLLHLLHDVIKIPVGPPAAASRQRDDKSKKRKRGSDASGGKPTEHSTIVFTATKHHVEYLATLLRYAGFSVSHVYGSLDQEARRHQVEDFRRGKTNILVVTDVAARGVDIPILANVVNYDFPPQPKVFVHRVGRTARAGQRGWSYSLVRDIDAPYLVDLQLFLGKKLVVGQEGGDGSFADDVVVGSARRDSVEPHVEWMNKALDESDDLSALRRVAGKAEKLYMKTRNSASSQSAKRARSLVASSAWTQIHGLFREGASDDVEQARAAMLAKISGFKPPETIFEVGHADKSTSRAANVMKQLRKRITPRSRQDTQKTTTEDIDDAVQHHKQTTNIPNPNLSSKDNNNNDNNNNDDDDDDEEEGQVEVTVSNDKSKKKNQSSWLDPDSFITYTPRTTTAAESRAYGVHSGGSQTTPFLQAARAATMDLTNDETAKSFGVPSRQRMRWDAKSKKYTSRDNDEDGSRGARMIKGESGVKIAASFQSGRYDRWRREQRMSRLPLVGESENPSLSSRREALPLQNGRFRHRQERAPREADKFRDDFHAQRKR
ncbi:ATP-dependent RNA helicase DBP10 [Ophiocordyceps camponoti-floridani]|uniref:RNA helicase n=1 Tax=Ophiocordyceps camponoti-floridani TaxID=2030778 RepID=A0A8H4QB63_9HYPO|nr:ATP-dependent RNA helicase DBP10 [Ophiocordyceps camponoti-floridani]